MDRMRISFVVSWVAVVGLFTGSSLAAEPLRIVTLGDSITKGVRPGVTDQETFAAELQRQLRAGQFPDAEVINVGIGGEMAGQGLKRLENDVVAKKPSIVTIMYGHNDSYVDAGKTEARVSIPRFRGDLSQLVQRLREAGIVPILMTPPAYAEKSGPNGIGEHCNIKLAQYAEVTRQVAETLQVPLIDHFAAWSETSKNGTDLNDWTTDGYHPNPKAHVELATRMLPIVVSSAVSSLNIPVPEWIKQPGDEWKDFSLPGVGIYRRDQFVLFSEIPKETRELRFPKLNNVVIDAQIFSPGKLPYPASFKQSPTEWIIKIPSESFTRIRKTHASVLIQVSGMPRYCSSPAIARPNAGGVITLSARDAVVHGEKLQFEPLTHKNTVGYWVNPQDFAEWNYSLDTPGEFEVEIMQGCGGHAGSQVEFEFSEGSVPFVVEETGHFQNFVWRKIGRVVLKEMGTQKVALRCRKLANAAVMDVRQIRLVPTSSSESTVRDLRDVEADLVPPLAMTGAIEPGRRQIRKEETSARYSVYLPTNWSADQKWPILVELPGNGSYRDALGNVCDGLPESGQLAYGLSGGYGAICLAVPFLDDENEIAPQWWGTAPEFDATNTLNYWSDAIADVCEVFNGDPNRVILVGFSRGSIAVNAIGLSSKSAAGLWKAAVCYSHYDGVGNWPFAKSDAESAIERLKRLGNRPQYIISESPVEGPSLSDQAKEFINKSGVTGDFTYATTGFINHSDQWALRPSPARTKLREWLAKQMQP